MGVFGEVAKFLWFLCESIKEEPEACYIMATEFATVSIPVLMIMEPEWSYKKAEVVSCCIRRVDANAFACTCLRRR